MPVGQKPFGQMPFGQMPFGQMPFGQMPYYLTEHRTKCPQCSKMFVDEGAALQHAAAVHSPRGAGALQDQE